MKMKKFNSATFGKVKREKLLDYKIYSYNFDDHIETFEVVSEDMSQPAEMLATTPSPNLMQATFIRASHAVNQLQTLYSAGHDISHIRACYPTFVEYWEEYAQYSGAYKNTPEARHVTVGHFGLAGDEYADALAMVSFGILLGWNGLLHRLAPILDYRNRRDGLLERLLQTAGIDRDPPPGECLRHLPYFKSLKIFEADPADRAMLMTEYLEDWYHASRREPYYDSHKRDTSFLGYWSWESAAITVLLDIDDTSYRDAQFYPRDLVDFARMAKRDYAPPGLPPAAINELRAKAGDPCPKAGTWVSLDVESTRRRFEFEQPMPDLNSAYGLTVWRFLDRADD
jgi:hypothetical protein